MSIFSTSASNIRTSLHWKSKTNGRWELQSSGGPPCQLFGTQVSYIDVYAV